MVEGKPRKKTTLRQRARFLAEFALAPFTIGAIAPSSRRLAAKMVEGVDLSKARAVVEFGPGTGVFTEAILARLPKTCKFFAIELHPTMVDLWRQRFPGRTIYQDSVRNVDVLCAREGIDEVDVVFSGLPWASFDGELQDATLAATHKVLRPGGELITFGYRVGTILPKGQRFYKRLPQVFSRVERSKYVWRNLPPAFVVRCGK